MATVDDPFRIRLIESLKFFEHIRTVYNLWASLFTPPGGLLGLSERQVRVEARVGSLREGEQGFGSIGRNLAAMIDA